MPVHQRKEKWDGIVKRIEELREEVEAAPLETEKELQRSKKTPSA